MSFILPTLLFKLTMRASSCIYGKNLRVCGANHIRLKKKGAILIGKNVAITSRYLTNPVGSMPTMLECILSGSITIGDNSGLTSSLVSSRNRIVIGNNVKIGGNTKILDHDFHSLDYLDRRSSKADFANVKSESIIIGNDVFIGCDSVILKGVYVGDRCIIAAGSVLSNIKIPSDSLVAGNPAKIIKSIR